jgi:hypothetical protein
MLDEKTAHAGFPAKSAREYINKILELLLEDIEVKSKNYKKPILTILFALNNCQYILKSLKGTIFGEAVSPKVTESIELAIKKNLDSYRTR